MNLFEDILLLSAASSASSSASNAREIGEKLQIIETTQNAILKILGYEFVEIEEEETYANWLGKEKKRTITKTVLRKIPPSDEGKK